MDIANVGEQTQCDLWSPKLPAPGQMGAAYTDVALARLSAESRMGADSRITFARRPNSVSPIHANATRSILRRNTRRRFRISAKEGI